jgi:hypothetical protein
MGSRVDLVNRVVLAVMGTALIALAALGLARGLGRMGAAPSSDPILADDRSLPAWADAWWVVPSITALALILALLSCRWLLEQLRRDGVRQLEVDPTRRGGDTWLRAPALAEAVEQEVERLPGVESAAMRLTGTRGRHRHRLVVTLNDRADVPAVRSSVTTTTVPRIHRCLDFEQPDVDVELVLAPRERRRLR